MADNLKALVLVVAYMAISLVTTSYLFHVYPPFGVLAVCAFVALLNPVLDAFYD